jgi:hypothetical protein
MPLLLLLAGLASYWFLQPDIPLFSFLEIHNPHPLTAAGRWWAIRARHHLADALFCAAAFLVAARLREGGWPAFYPGFLLALPFAGEVLQGMGIVPGTFDRADLLTSVVVLALIAAWRLVTCGNRRSIFRVFSSSPCSPWR